MRVRPGVPHKTVAVRNHDRMGVDKSAAVNHRITVGPVIAIRIAIAVGIGVVGVRVSRIG